MKLTITEMQSATIGLQALDSLGLSLSGAVKLKIAKNLNAMRRAIELYEVERAQNVSSMAHEAFADFSKDEAQETKNLRVVKNQAEFAVKDDAARQVTSEVAVEVLKLTEAELADPRVNAQMLTNIGQLLEV